MTSDAAENNGAPIVTVMIPTYMQSNLIVRAVESALAQTLEDIEILISDDASPDNTCEVVAGLLDRLEDARVRYVRNPDNLGILRNYHHTLYYHARGEYVVNLDGDDYFTDPSFLTRAVGCAREFSDIVLVISDYSEVDSETGVLTPIRNRFLDPCMPGVDFVRRFASGKISWNHNAMLYSRKHATSTGFYWDPDIPRNDWESFLRLALGAHVGYVDSCVSAWVQHPRNATRKTSREKYLRNFDLIDNVCRHAAMLEIDSKLVGEIRRGLEYQYASGACVAYIKELNYMGLADYLLGVMGRRRILLMRLLSSPMLWVKALLSTSPSLYNRLKRAARHA